VKIEAMNGIIQLILSEINSIDISACSINCFSLTNENFIVIAP
jgi:hypothetical protein